MWSATKQCSAFTINEHQGWWVEENNRWVIGEYVPQIGVQICISMEVGNNAIIGRGISD
jgi:hypothetical protein